MIKLAHAITYYTASYLHVISVLGLNDLVWKLFSITARITGPLKILFDPVKINR